MFNLKFSVFILMFVTIFSFVMSDNSFAEPTHVNLNSSAPVVVNHIICSDQSTSWTSRDLELFTKIKNLMSSNANGVFKLVNFELKNNEFKPLDEFLLIRLAAKEAQLFEITPVKLSAIDTSILLRDFAKEEVQAELSSLGLALAMIRFKELQLKEASRFITWFEILKRKYQVKMKSK
jgi:hypothetical protein